VTCDRSAEIFVSADGQTRCDTLFFGMRTLQQNMIPSKYIVSIILESVIDQLLSSQREKEVILYKTLQSHVTAESLSASRFPLSTTSMNSEIEDTSPTPPIPPEIKDQLLPDPALSVSQLLQYQLPAVWQGPPNEQTSVESYLTNLPVNVTSLNAIKSIPIPSKFITTKLERHSRLASSTSIRCTHIHFPSAPEKRVPTWVVTYWIEAGQILRLKKKWLDAESSLQKRRTHKNRTKETAGLISCIYEKLSSIQWSGNMHGFSASVPIHHLTSFLSQEWLSDHHETQMLDLLRLEINRKQAGSVQIGNVFFTTHLKEIHKNASTYTASKEYEWLCRMGQEFATGIYDTYATISNINQNHWIALIIDFRSSIIYYGDSIGGIINDDLEAALTWWTNYHTGNWFPTKTLPITRQRDGHSCGILAWNAIASFLQPETYPLMDSDVGIMADERLRMFLKIVDQHNERVSHYLQT